MRNIAVASRQLPWTFNASWLIRSPLHCTRNKDLGPYCASKAVRKHKPKQVWELLVSWMHSEARGYLSRVWGMIYWNRKERERERSGWESRPKRLYSHPKCLLSQFPERCPTDLLSCPHYVICSRAKACSWLFEHMCRHKHKCVQGVRWGHRHIHVCLYTWETEMECNGYRCLSRLRHVLSHVQLFVTPWTAVQHAPLSMGISQARYLSRLPFPALGHLTDPGLNPCVLHGLHWQVDFLFVYFVLFFNHWTTWEVQSESRGPWLFYICASASSSINGEENIYLCDRYNN